MSPAHAYSEARRAMVERQLKGRAIKDPGVLRAMGEVPREAFTPESLKALAYDDGALPIEDGQTISQPYIVARMLEAAAIGSRDRVLEVGAGSGYAAAVMSLIAGETFAIERRRALAEQAQGRLAALGFPVRLRIGDGARGWPEAAPFDAIVVSAATRRVPDALFDQLGRGGRLVAPLGEPGGSQRLTLFRRVADHFETKDLGEVTFVPLIEG